jgi:hypothetical protein
MEIQLSMRSKTAMSGTSGPYAWDIFNWQVAFSCRSNLCQRDWCLLHRRNPQKIYSVDIYSLISTFEGISVATAKSHVAKWFGLKLGDLESKGVRDTTRQRRKVPKKELLAVFERYKNMRFQHVDTLIAELKGVIERSDVVEWHRRLFDEDYTFMKDSVVDNLFKIKSPAVKAYVWLLIRQEELARNTKGPRLEVSDSELAEGIGVTKTTAQNYREKLGKLKPIEASKGTWSKSREIAIEKVFC